MFLTNGPISHILRNRHYLGELNHKGQSWPGEHEAIVDPQIFARVQEKLVEQRHWRIADRAKSRALLLGKLFNGAGERMTPSYAVKKGVRYRYYISVSAMQSRAAAKSLAHRVPAESLEDIVIKSLMQFCEDNDRAKDSSASEACPVATNITSLAPNARNPNPNPGSDADLHARALVDQRLNRVTVHAGFIEITLSNSGDPDEPPKTMQVPWIKPSSTRRREILEPDAPTGNARLMGADERVRLVRSIAIARTWIDELIQGAMPDTAALAVREKKSERSVRMTLSLAFLDPALIKAACLGQLPRGFGTSRLVDLPAAFGDQWRVLGLTRPV